jgi:hypothetical protein
MDSSENTVEQSFALAHRGYSQVMLQLSRLSNDDPCPADLTARLNIAKDALEKCTALLQQMFRHQAAKLTPRGTELLGLMAALVKEHYGSQWQKQVVTARLTSQSDEAPMSLHQDLAVARINNCLSELLEVVRGDEKASQLVRYCLGVQTQLIQMHCMTDGLALAEIYLDYRELFFRDFHPRMLVFSPGFVSFMLTLLNRASASD